MGAAILNLVLWIGMASGFAADVRIEVKGPDGEMLPCRIRIMGEAGASHQPEGAPSWQTRMFGLLGPQACFQLPEHCPKADLPRMQNGS